jgi:multidrug transporter EmrE-like cation transporter
MTKHGLLLAGLGALLSVVSNLMLRSGMVRAGGFGLSSRTFVDDLLRLAHQPLFVAGSVLYATAALVWFQVISTENLSSSYPFGVGFTFMLMTVGSVLLLREPVSCQKIAGMGVLLAGIVLVARA